MVHYLVEAGTSASLTMLIATLIPTLILETLTLFQVEYKTRTQS